MTSDQEEQLIGECVAGDASAFEPLVRRYHRPLFHVAARLLRDPEDARDATQTAFLRAYQALGSREPGRPFFSWVYRILVNDCLNTLRGRRPSQPLDDRLVAAGSVDPVESAETRVRVRRALMQLPSEQRDVVILRHFAQMSYAEAAVALGIPERTVKSRLFSARQRLCALLVRESL